MSPVLYATVQASGEVVPVLVFADGTLIASGGGSGTGTLSGAGSPQGSVAGTAGQVYVNTSNNTFYVSTGGTNWTIAGGGSGAMLYSGSGAPEGVVAAEIGSIYTDVVTALMYQKLTGSGNAGWTA